MVESLPPPHSSSNDSSLIRRYADGDSVAAEKIFKKYAQRIRALAKARVNSDLTARVDADDVVQSVFRAFFHRASKGNYNVLEGGDLWHLLAVVTINKVRSLHDHHQASKRSSRQTEEIPDQGHGVPFDDQGQMEIALKDILLRLPDPVREIVQLRLEGYEMAEIAKQTRRSQRTVERLLQNARTVLDDLLRVSRC